MTEKTVEKICIHCYVSGQVQGVWFRASTKDQAHSLALSGWARNLPDGRVEVMACGERQQLETLYAWLKIGPARAKVTDVSYEELPWVDYKSFNIR